MKLVKEGTLDKVQASANMYLATKDLKDVYGNFLYLGKFDSINNYVEVDKTTRDRILAEQEELAKTE